MRLFHARDGGDVDAGLGQPFEPCRGIVGADHANEADVYSPEAHAGSGVDGVAAELARGDAAVGCDDIVERTVADGQEFAHGDSCGDLIFRLAAAFSAILCGGQTRMRSMGDG